MSKKPEHSAPLSAELIQKYREGKLSAAEMHRVERLLLEDPFYADAMEGLEDQADLNIHMADLKERLAQRVSASQKSIPMYRHTWQIAAAVVMLVVGSWVGYYYFNIGQDKPAEQMLSMQNETDAVPQQKPMPLKDEMASEPPEATAPVENPVSSKNQESEPPVNEVITDTEEAELVEKETPPILSAPETLPPITAQQPEMGAEIEADEQIAISKVPEASAGNAYRSTRLLKSADAGAEVYGESNSLYTLKGRVISGEDKAGLPGVNVIIKNTGLGTVTDVDGNFKLSIPENKNEVVFNFIGFQATEKQIAPTDSNLTVVLESDIQALSEVVVGYGAQEKKAAVNITQAKPAAGYAAYKDYLKENLQYPQDAKANNIEGTVRVAFEVLPNGALQNFSVEKPMGYGCDEEAIRLIKEGPAWQPALEDGKAITQNVTVKVKFSL